MRGMKMLDWKQSFILQSRRKLARLLTKIRAVWRELTAEEQPTEVCEKPYRSTDPTTKVATQLKWMLMKIYRPQIAFELRVTMQRPKSRIGYYVPAKRSITIHGGWRRCPLVGGDSYPRIRPPYPLYGASAQWQEGCSSRTELLVHLLGTYGKGNRERTLQ